MPHRKDQVDKSVDQQWGLPFRVILQNETPLPRIGGKADFVPKLRQRYSELIQARSSASTRCGSEYQRTHLDYPANSRCDFCRSGALKRQAAAEMFF
jgi:hypothetical protein